MKEHIERFRILENAGSGAGRLEPKPPSVTEAAPSKALSSADEAATSHLNSYLDYYRSCEQPGYAVLITGAWGTGKTYQVRKAIPKDEVYYVSLFGLKTTDEVVAAIYTAMFPGKAWLKNIANKIGETTAEVEGVGSLAINGLTSGLVGAFLRQEVDSSKPIIFDDLERCGLRVKEILGIINQYVEQHGCRVVVIAHDKKLADAFGEAKEKIFGQTIRVEPQVAAAFDQFLSAQADGAAKDLIAARRDDILGAFLASGAESLRILRHVIADLARLIDVLDDRHLAHKPAMMELVRLFSALDTEWRADKLKEPDLRRRMEASVAYGLRRKLKDGEKVPLFIAARDRHSSVDITSTLLQDDILVQMLVEGRYDKTAIQASLDASPYFVKSETSPPWRIVSGFDKLEDEVVAEGLARMQQQFDNREVSDSGEMLHIFALMMMMASKGVLGKDVKAVETECKSYINDLLRDGRLPPRGSDWRWHDDFSRSSHGYVYWVTEEYESEFRSVLSHLMDARGKALEGEFPKLTSELLKVVETDGQQFFEEICHTSQGNNRYATIPILAAIEPEDFVAAWMRSPKPNWYWISNALKDRYNSGYLGRELKPEREWISKVIELLKEEESKALGLAKVRIQRTIPNISLPSVKRAEPAGSPLPSAAEPQDDAPPTEEED
jgi:hypothetical protein